MLAVYSQQQVSLYNEVHSVVFSLSFVHDVFDVDTRVGSEEKSRVGVGDLSALYDVVLELAVLLTVVLDIHPELVLVTQHLFNPHPIVRL